ncbi:MAG: DUF2064 domain-containing protein [Gammaproteobacteria bacterium]|nr:DUF2064 domain-containing protein [Gammaproteobacteria bacterium]
MAQHESPEAQPTVQALTLVLVCKRPRLGHGKQRIAAQIGAQRACALAGLLLDCALEDAQAWPGPLVLAPDSAEDAAWAQALMPGARVRAQGQGNLGERLQRLDESLRGEGCERLAFIGSDAPGLSAADVAAAAEALLSHDVALSPATDGGVVLMAARRPWPALAPLPWSGGDLGTALAAACTAAGLGVVWLSAGWDVDTIDDLRQLPMRLLADQRPARRRLREWAQAQAF